MKAHYHVTINTPGYVAEDDPYIVTSKRAAAAAVADEARRYRESEWDLPRAERRTGRGSGKAGYIYFDRPGDPYDLGLAMSWTRCEDPGCEQDED
jgi:hypothetical protein